MSFIALHVHSTYTYLSSALNVNKIVSSAKINNYKAVALTDFNSLTASVKFFDKCNKENIKPILGIDILLDNLSLTLLVKNEEGYKNVLFILKSFNEKTLSKEIIKTHKDGIIAILPIVNNNLHNKFNEIKNDKFAFYLNDYFSLFNEFYIGIDTYTTKEKESLKNLKEFLLKRDYKLVAFPLIRYQKKEDEIAYQLALAIKEDKHFDDSFRSANGLNYFIDEKEANERYEIEEINNTNLIADSISFSLIKKRGKLIKYCPNDDEVLKNTSYEMLAKKITITEEYKTRLDYELNVIKKMGYSSYFLIVMDYVMYAKKEGILVGAGRGSAGGSLVAYALNIITIDPVKEGLIFERFLNEGRKTLPDIDVDFEDIRKEEVASYVRNKYGKDKVGNILAVQTLKAKASIRDIGRIYNIKESYINILCNALDEDDDLHLAYKRNETFRRIVNSDKYYLFIVTMASKIEGFPRQTSIHPAGIIINDEELYKSLPLNIDDNGNYLCQLEKDALEELGYLKMDLLPLTNLNIIKNVLDEVNKDKQILAYEDIPYDDTDAIKLIATGETLGIFQLEKKGMIRTIKEFKPQKFEDIVILVSLYRPGPMESIPEYIARKEGKRKIIYPSNKIIDILKPTYGIIVYQEQIMEIASVMANFSYTEADNFRRAISKKDAAILGSLKNNFIKGAINNGCTQKESEEVFNLIYKFANYGFNRSHAYAYAKLATQMAYLKLHYPAIFYSAILDASKNFLDIIGEMKSRGIKILLPDINLASNKYIAKDNSLIIPISSIKGITNLTIMQILKERNEHGLFSSLDDFILRTAKFRLTESFLIKLIDSGCFDSFSYSRSCLRASINNMISLSKLFYGEGNQISLDDSFIPKLFIKNVPSDESYDLEMEMANLGIYISKSPLDFVKDKLIKEGATSFTNFKNKGYGKIAGFIKSIRRIKTRKDNRTMAFMTISDNYIDINVTIFSDLYYKYEDELYSAKIILVTGKYDKRRDEVIADELKVL